VDKKDIWRQKQGTKSAKASQQPVAKIAGCFGVEKEPRVRDETLPHPARRDILFVATGAMATVAVGAAVWPLIAQMNPDASTLALASTDVDLSGIAPGQIVTVKWRGKPVFVRRRTPAEIQAAEQTPLNVLPDPQPDSARVKKPEWLVVVGVCTHLGCIPLGHEGELGGWF
jgi:ubiquinol-cytochrome c reductase iron-sulfur subunit